MGRRSTMERRNLFCFVLTCLACVTHGFIETEADHTVTLRSGRLKGMEVQLPDENLPPIVVYRGISYASVRGGEMRFMPPTSTSEKWDAIRLAKNFGPVCPQRALDEQGLLTEMPKVKVEHLKRVARFTRKQAEDCLNLNLYVPVQGSRTSQDLERPPFAVVVFIHGDSYQFGTGNAYDGSVLASYGRVIVVTLNYRLGALGFFSTMDQHAPGNYAVLDIVAALQWLKQNIGRFGGDPSRVTLLGQGTGGALVNILSSYAPYTQPLFRRILLQSGSALASWAVCSKPIKWARKLSDSLNCTNERATRDHFKMVRCIKEKSADQIVLADVHSGGKFFCTFCPVVSGEYGAKILPGNVKDIITNPRAPFNKMEILVGLTRDEGFSLLRQSQIDGINSDQRDHMIESYVNSLYKQRQQSISLILDYSYKDHERLKDSAIMRTNMMEMLADGQFNVPMIQLANLHAPKNKTYFYVFGYPSRGPDYPDGGASVQGDDLMYLMGAPFADVSPFRVGFGNGERMISEAVMRYFTNFIKSGNPNMPRPLTSVVLTGRATTNRYENLKWELYNLTTKSYMHLGMRPSMKHNYRGDEFPLWVDLIPNVQKDNTTSKRHIDSSMLQTPPPPTPPPLPPPRSTLSPKRPTKRPAYETPSGSEGPKVRTGQSNDGMGQDNAMTETTRDPPISMSLSITIAVGCSLLFLNIIVFAAVYYQKDKLKFEKKLREKEKERDRLEGERSRRNSSMANSKAEQETDSLLEEGEHKAPPPTPHRNNSLPRTPLINHVNRHVTPPPPANHKTPTSPEKLLSRISDPGRFTPSPRLDLDNNRRSDSTDSGTMMNNGSDDAPVTMV